MSDESIKSSEDVKEYADSQSVKHANPAPVQQVSRGGFMGGGVMTTLLFLLAFFLVSYSLGVVTERNTKLLGGNYVANTGNGRVSSFNIAGFKKAAADLKLDTNKFNSCLDSGKQSEAVKKDAAEGGAVGVEGTPSFVINGVGLVGAHPMSVFEQVLDGKTIPPDATATASAGLYDGKKVDKQILLEDARVKGDKNAKITIYEFSDFQCPYCASFYSNSYKSIVEKYVSTGKAKIVFKDYPLTALHPQAQKAAEAARCAQEQGKFWEMHDKLFELQTQEG